MEDNETIIWTQHNRINFNETRDLNTGTYTGKVNPTIVIISLNHAIATNSTATNFTMKDDFL